MNRHMRWPGPMLNTIFIFITLVSFFWEETTRHPKCAAGATATHTVVLLLERHILRKKSNVSPSRKQSLKNTRIAAAPQRWFLANIYTHVAGRWTREQGIVTQKTAPYRPTAGHKSSGCHESHKSSPFCKTGVTAKSTFPRSSCFALPPKKLVVSLMTPKADGGPRDRPELPAVPPCCAFICILGVRLLAQGKARRGAPEKGTKRAPKTRAYACFAAAKPPGTTPSGSSSF